jgi:macrolide transport system ATP-binding/permease protein
MIAFFRKLGWLGQWRSKEKQLAAELQFHLDQEIEERQAAGMSAQDARDAARRELGNLTLVQEDTRATWRWTLLEQLVQDLRYGARTMLCNPAFTILASLSLALGIGANTAIYSLMDALLMRRLPVVDSASLVLLKWHITGKVTTDNTVVHHASGYFDDDPKTGKTSPIFPFPAFEVLRTSSDALSVLFAYRPAGRRSVIVGQQAEITGGEYVSGDYFRGLGIVPAGGRVITRDDDRTGASAVVVLSHGFAVTRFGDAASAVGQKVLIDNIPFTTIGVTPQGFFGVDPSKSPDLYLPFHADLLLDPEREPGSIGRYQDEHYYWTEMMGRLRPGVTIAQAQAGLAPVFDTWVAGTATTDLERKYLPRFLLQDGAAGVDRLRRSYSKPVYILLAMVAMILAIACANIANLLLARSETRRREVAVRLSIGAGRWRVIRQLLTESILLSLLGGGAGILVAGWGMRFLAKLLFAGDSLPLRPELSSGVLAATLLLTVVTGVLFGLAPALQAARVDPMPALKESRSGGPRSGARLRFGLGRMLVISQLAICLLLLVGANLFVRTLANLHSLDVGFEREKLLVFKVNARQAGHRGPEILSFYDDLKRRLAAIPGVHNAAMANSPLIGAGAWGWPIVPLGEPRPENAPTGHGSGFSRSATHVLGVAPGFFSTMRIPLLAGREFDETDRRGGPPAAIVNEAWAKVNLAGRNPVGQSVISFGLHTKPQQVEIVGLARNARYDDLTGDFPAIVYMPLEQNAGVPVDEMTFFLRTDGNPSGYAGAVREAVHQADTRIPVAALSTQTAQIEHEMSAETMFARLCTAFAMLSLAIACVGLYGTTSYAVARRTSEIGIRMALGARRDNIVWMVLRDVLMLAIIGLAIGLPMALVASKVIESVLFGVKPGDPWSLVSGLTILLSAALAAGYLPAWKASRTDPMVAVRHE